MYEDDELVPKQVSLPLSMKRKLKEAAVVSGKTESGIVRDALAAELEKPEYKSD
jgi:predicted DNA-binding protein